MQRVSDLAATIEVAAESLAALLDPSRCEQLSPVSPAQLRVLLLLRARPALNVNGLAEALHVGPSSASRLCDRLEALGLVSRVCDPRDRREVQLPLTPAAVQMLDELSRYRRQALEMILSAMPPTARQEMARSMALFSAAADESSGSAADPDAGVRRSA
jgi:DNA-binding MarR family transcriptional regulator